MELQAISTKYSQENSKDWQNKKLIKQALRIFGLLNLESYQTEVKASQSLMKYMN